MEITRTQTLTRRPPFRIEFTDNDSDRELTQRRLDALLFANAEIEYDKSLYRSERQRFEAGMMRRPLSIQQTFAYFGLMLGVFPPAALFTRFSLDTMVMVEDSWIILPFILIIMLSATVGYLSGKLVGKTVLEAEKLSWTRMLLVLPFVGLVWGIAAGSAGGIIVFIVGAFFGALLGSIVGACALPVFAIFHRIIKRGEFVELKHFLPIAFGVALAISAFMLGL